MPQYTQDVLAVSTAMTSVLTAQLPEMSDPPDDWSDYVQAYSSATTDALNWVNTVLSRLLTVPQEVAGYSGAINGFLSDAATQAKQLAAFAPGSSSKALASDLSELVSTLTLIEGFVSGAVTALTGFQGTLPTTAASLSAIATKAAADANADQKNITATLSSIAALRSDLSAAGQELLSAETDEAQSITIGVIVTMALFPAGMWGWVIFGAAINNDRKGIDASTAKIVDDQQALVTAQSSLSASEAQLVPLQGLAASYSGMATSATQVESDLTAILGDWTSLAGAVNTVLSDINRAVSHVPNYDVVASDIQQAVTDWSAVSKAANSLAITINVNSAALVIGQSPSEVQSTLAGGTVVGAIEYYNTIGA